MPPPPNGGRIGRAGLRHAWARHNHPPTSGHHAGEVRSKAGRVFIVMA